MRNTLTLEPFQLLALVAIFFFTSIISVVTGSTSLLTVPVMLQFAIEPRTAVATNMFALIFMSLGGSLSFRNRNVIDRRRSPFLIILTLVSSVLGALLLLVIPSQIILPIVAILMITIVLFSMINTNAGVAASVERQTSPGMEIAGYGATFILGVYGGFFSGGYVTLLTAVFVLLFGMSFVQAISTTKLINIFSSLVATFIFMWRGLVDYKLGILLGTAMFIGALIGGSATLRLSNLWIRRIFVTAVIALAFKTLFYDYFFLKLLAG